MLLLNLRVEKVFFLCLMISSVPKQVVGERTKPKSVHSSAFEDVRIGKRVSGSGTLLEGSERKTKCSAACSKKEDCLSFTFCGNRTCYLNNQDVFSTGSGAGILEDDEMCIYFGMKRESVPICHDNGVFADIRSDHSSGACKITQKRVDHEWGDWKDDDFETEKEWKKIRRRDLITQAAHGGVDGDLDSEEITLWVLLVKEKMTWIEAKNNCDALGGKLFWNLNVRWTKVRSLWTQLGEEDYWIGIHTDDHIVWKNVHNEVMQDSLLNWRSGEPDNNQDSEYVVAVKGIESSAGSRWVRLSDEDVNLQLASVCDMI